MDEKVIAKRHRYATMLYDLRRGGVVEDVRRKTGLAGLYKGLARAQREAQQTHADVA